MELGEWDGVRKGGSQREGLVTWIGYIDFRLSLLPRFQGRPDDASSPEKGTSLSFIRRTINISSIHHKTPASFTPEVPNILPFQHAAHKYSLCGSETGLSTRLISQATVSVGTKPFSYPWLLRHTL
jgi:hypothetical protein